VPSYCQINPTDLPSPPAFRLLRGIGAEGAHQSTATKDLSGHSIGILGFPTYKNTQKYLFPKIL